MRSFHVALREASPWLAISLTLLFLLCGQGFEARKSALGQGNNTLDGRWSYTPTDATKLFRDLGERGRRIYAITEVTLDLLFPSTYGLLFAILIAHGFPTHSGAVLTLIPVTAALFDVLENLSIAYMALTFAGQVGSLAVASEYFTRVKMILFAASVVMVMIGVPIQLRRLPVIRAGHVPK